jgi:hypothetical protein
MCALFGSSRDFNTMMGINYELINDIISQNVGYYKISLNDTKANLYGESLNKQYIGPVLLSCLIERGDFATTIEDGGLDRSRPVTFRFLRNMMVDANVYPEAGDVIMYNELYFQVENVNDNQMLVGKDNNYAYSDGLENFGGSVSYILTAYYTSGDKLGITQQIAY